MKFASIFLLTVSAVLTAGKDLEASADTGQEDGGLFKNVWDRLTDGGAHDSSAQPQSWLFNSGAPFESADVDQIKRGLEFQALHHAITEEELVSYIEKYAAAGKRKWTAEEADDLRNILLRPPPNGVSNNPKVPNDFIDSSLDESDFAPKQDSSSSDDKVEKTTPTMAPTY